MKILVIGDSCTDVFIYGRCERLNPEAPIPVFQPTKTVTNQGTITSPNLYGDSVTQVGGEKGTLAGTLSPTGVPTVTAGGAGTSATAQRSIELSVFK